MTIEVRQIVIRSTVSGEGAVEAQPTPPLSAQERERLKADLLAECREWIAEKLREARER